MDEKNEAGRVAQVSLLLRDLGPICFQEPRDGRPVPYLIPNSTATYPRTFFTSAGSALE